MHLFGGEVIAHTLTGRIKYATALVVTVNRVVIVAVRKKGCISRINEVRVQSRRVCYEGQSIV